LHALVAVEHAAEQLYVSLCDLTGPT
jgi:hypothetical protein